MSRTMKIIVAIWLIAVVAWIAVIVGNVRANGWGIIGIGDILPMSLCAVAMVMCICVNVRRSREKNGD